MIRFSFFTVIFLSQASALTVNEAIPITHQVQVNPIRVQNTSGAKANYLGTPQQQAAILTKVNRIWAQAGVEIIWGPLQSYTNNFAYDNNGASYPRPTQQNPNRQPRPTNHLNQTVALSDAPTKASNTDVDLFFVKTSPGGFNLNDFDFSGLAFVDGQGITLSIGSGLYSSDGNQDLVANLIAHEIGHNLGLQHEDNGNPINPPSWPDNLMSPGPTTQQLTPAQKDTIFIDNPGRDGFDMLEEVSRSNFEDFLISNNLTGGAEGDPDQDSLNNLMEFAIGSDPRKYSTLPPVIRQGTNDFRWAVPKSNEAIEDGVSFQIFVSDDLQTWKEAGDPGTDSAIVTDDNTQIITRVINRDHNFFRFSALLPSS